MLWNQSAVHNCDAVPVQSWHDDLKDQTTTPGVNETPVSSDDRNATAGGASCEAPALRPSGDATRHLGTHEDSYQLLHKSNLVSLRTPFPTHREGQGTSKCYHAVEYCCRLLGRQDPTLNGPTAQGAMTTFSRKITTLMLSGIQNASTALAGCDVTAQSAATRVRLQNNSDQPPSTRPYDATTELANSDSLLHLRISEHLSAQQD